MSYFPGMQKGNLDSVKSDAHGNIKKETVALQGVSVTRVTFDVGAKWSNDLKDYAGAESCRLPHVALVLSGTLRVVMDDGSHQDFRRTMLCCCRQGMMRGRSGTHRVCSSNLLEATTII